MLHNILSKTVVCFILGILIVNISKGTDRAEEPKGRHISMAEESLLRELGLKEDVNDIVIIQLLDDPEKRSSAALLISYRKIYSATPKLLQIVNDPNLLPLVRVGAARTLCDFGNKEWVPAIKTFITDPNSTILNTPYAIKVAGLLARAGDYSHFELVAKSTSDSKWWIRHTAVMALGNFGHKTDPVTDSALELLTSTAMADPMPRLRDVAIRSLEKIAKTKPEVESKVIAALEANKDSTDKALSLMCKTKLKIHSEKSEK